MRARAACVVILLAACGGRSGLRSPDVGIPDAPPSCVHPKVVAGCSQKWCNVLAGCFTMGSPVGALCRQNTEAAHQVTLTRDIQIWQTEVTQNEFSALMGYNPSYFNTYTRPVENVSWHEAAAYCNALSKKLGLGACYSCTGTAHTSRCAVGKAYSGSLATIYDCPGVRLPTEAEWEYVNRAGSSTAYYAGANTTCTNEDPVLSKIGYYARNSGKATQVVAKKLPNAWGLFDMSGNVWEWTNDWWNQDLGTSAVTDPPGPASGIMRVVKGGAWGSAAGDARAASRDGVLPDRRYNSDGFRVVRSIP